MIDEKQSKAISLKTQHRLDAWRYRELRLAIILILKLLLIALPASFFIFGCVSHAPITPVPQIEVKLYALDPERQGIVRKGVVTPFKDAKNFIVISPDHFGELLTRCPIE